MNDEEWEISRSTPSARFDRPAPSPTSPTPPCRRRVAAAPVPDDGDIEAAAAFVDADDCASLRNPSCCSHSSGVSSAGRCGGCSPSSACSIGASTSTRCRTRPERWGERVRAALTARTGIVDHSAGVRRRPSRRRRTDVIEAWGNGTLQRDFEAAGVAFAGDAVIGRAQLPAGVVAAAAKGQALATTLMTGPLRFAARHAANRSVSFAPSITTGYE